MSYVTFEALVSAARSGHSLISFPTDTVPALAARPDQADLIFAAKHRSPDKPLILMAGEIADLWPYVLGSSDDQRVWQATAEQYLPGALTLVLPASDRVPSAMNPQNPSTIGVRVPNHPLARAILRQTGPLATTSANRSGQPALQTMTDIAAQFPQALQLLSSEVAALESSQPPLRKDTISASGIPSTVACWTTTGWKILRQGAVVLEPPLSGT